MNNTTNKCDPITNDKQWLKNNDWWQVPNYKWWIKQKAMILTSIVGFLRGGCSRGGGGNWGTLRIPREDWGMDPYRTPLDCQAALPWELKVKVMALKSPEINTKQSKANQSKETNKQTNKQTKKQRNKETKKQRNKQTNNQPTNQPTNQTNKQTNKTQKRANKQMIP